MTDIDLVPWRLVVEATADQTERILTGAFGPERVADVRVGHDLDGVTVTFATTDRDPIWLVWEVVTELARLWPAFDAFVALTVHVDDVTVRTSASAMEAVTGGCRYAAWRSGVTVSLA